VDIVDRLTAPSFQPVASSQLVASSTWDSGTATAHLTRELHDGVAGELSTMLLDLERFRMAQVGRQSVLTEISQMQDRLRFVLSNVRQVLYERRGVPQVERDLAGSIRRGLVRRFAARTGVRVRLSVARSWPNELPSDTALHLHRILQEALNNVDRHSGATCVSIRFDVLADRRSGLISVADNGRGFATDFGGQAGFGLAGILERAVLLGGSATVSKRRRGGSVLTVLVPGTGLGL